jgi:Terminase large subunit, T4likevirus-type, N-terminal
VSAEISILKAMADLRLFGSAFKDISTWRAWMAFLAALFGIALSDDQADTFRACTARSAVPEGPFAEAWLVCGRRSGKSFIMALIAVFLAGFRDYRPYLGPGEKATIMVIAADRRQARVVLRYVRGLLAAPVLRKLVVNDTAESIELAGNTIIEVGTASHSIRGYTIAAALCDEIAFWPKEDSAAPDMEILAALRPAMATIPRSMLIAASSPYSRSGALWDAYRRNYGADDPSILVWRAPTLVMNPSVPKRIIDEAFERDPASAAAEYNAEFRSDIDSFVSREAVEACVEVGLRERAPASNVRYSAFVDPSGGSADSMTLAIGHKEGNGVILDAVRERKPPFSPEDVVEDFAILLKSYRVSKVIGDKYAGEWPRERFREHGVQYEPAAKPKSDLYRDLLPLINSRKIELLDDQRLVTQLSSLERRTARSGRDSIDHPPGAHDDVGNSVAGVAAALAVGGGYRADLSWVIGPDDEEAKAKMNYLYALSGQGSRQWYER